MRIVDAQIHLWGSGLPSNMAHRQVTSFTTEEAVGLMDGGGVHAAVIHPPSWDPNSTQMAFKAVRDFPGRFAILGAFPLSSPDRRALVETWRTQPGMLGLRYGFLQEPMRGWLADGTLDWLWAAAERAGVPIAMLATDSLPHIGQIAERHPGLRLTIDHLGGRGGNTTLKDDEAMEHMPALIQLARHPNIAVKATGAPGYCSGPYPFTSMHKYLRQIYDAFGPARMFWGTDITKMPCSWRECVTMFTEELPWLPERQASRHGPGRVRLVGLEEPVDDHGGSAMTNGPVLYQQRDGIVTLTLNRPETLNAMNEAMMGEIERILIELEADTAVRAVVLTGAGRAFSSGGDQKRSGESPPSFFEGDPGGALIERLNRCILRMQRLPKPIVGSINGVAAGAGMNIALATDLRIASDTSRFGEVFTRVGLVPDGGGTYFLPRLVGTARAMEMILLADIIDASEALRIGLVNRVVPAEQLAQETLKLAERLAQGPTVAYGLAKTGLYQGLGMSLENVLNMEARNQAIAARTPDRAEGVAAFLEKRPPRFTGRAGSSPAR